MDFPDLRYFAEVVRQRNLTKAAATLGIAQPALTRRIQLMERAFGAPLLLRHRRGVQPTEAGVIVYERAELMLRLAAEMRGEVLSQTAEPVGHVRFAYPPSLGNLFVARLIATYLERFPRVQFHLHEHFAPRVVDELLAGRIDMGIMSCAVSHPDLQCAPLFAERLWLIGRAADWPFASTRPLAATKLAGRPLLMTSSLRAVVEHAAEKRVLLDIRVEADALTTLRESVRAGIGFLLAPPSSVSQELESGEFTGAPVQGLSVTRGLFRRRDRPMTRALHELEDMVAREAERLRAAHRHMFEAVPGADAAR